MGATLEQYQSRTWKHINNLTNALRPLQTIRWSKTNLRGVHNTPNKRKSIHYRRNVFPKAWDMLLMNYRPCGTWLKRNKQQYISLYLINMYRRDFPSINWPSVLFNKYRNVSPRSPKFGNNYEFQETLNLMKILNFQKGHAAKFLGHVLHERKALWSVAQSRNLKTIWILIIDKHAYIIFPD